MSDYFIPGQVYTFRCLNLTEDSTRIISIELDNEANATITFNSDSILPGDGRVLGILAPTDEYTFDNGVISISGDLNKYWLLYFDETPDPIVNATTTGGGGTLTVSCPCGQGNGDCTPSLTNTDGSCKKVSCDPTDKCTICNKPVVTVGINVNEKTWVLLKAETAQQ